MIEIDKLFDEFIRERTFIHNLAPRTLGYYKQMYSFWRAVEAFNGLSKASLQEGLIKFRERGVSPGALNTYIRGVNTFLKWLHTEHGYADYSMQFLRTPRRIMHSVKDEDVKRFMNWKPKTYGDRRLKVLTLTILDTGLRIDEALSLTRPNLDFDNLLLTVIGKGDKERIIPFSVELRKTLYKFANSHQFDLIFCTAQGGKVTYCNALRDFTIMYKSLGIDLKGSAFHALRRTFATNFVRGGGNPFVLQRILGHASITQTQEYVKLVTDDLSLEHKRTSVLNRLR